MEKSRTGQLISAISKVLATIAVVCRSGSSKRIVTIRQSWTAASENTDGRPALAAAQTMFLSNTGQP